MINDENTKPNIIIAIEDEKDLKLSNWYLIYLSLSDKELDQIFSPEIDYKQDDRMVRFFANFHLLNRSNIVIIMASIYGMSSLMFVVCYFGNYQFGIWKHNFY